MRSPSLLIRSSAVLATGAWGVHQGRYRLAFGGREQEALARQGHHYLAGVTPLLILLLTAALGQALSMLARHREERDSRLAFAATWGLAFGALMTVFVAQELLEGALSSGHATGLRGVFAQGGWLSVPLAVVAAAAVAWLLRTVRRVLRPAGRTPGWGVLAAGVRAPGCPAALLVAFSPLAAQHAGRAPPRSS